MNERSVYIFLYIILYIICYLVCHTIYDMICHTPCIYISHLIIHGDNISKNTPDDMNMTTRKKQNHDFCSHACLGGAYTPSP